MAKKPGMRAGNPQEMDLEKRKQYGYLRDEHGTMPRINEATGEREFPMALKKAADKKTKDKKEARKEEKMNKLFGRLDKEDEIDRIMSGHQGMKKGGKVRAFKNGGAVMNGRGPKFKGQS